MPRVQVRSKSVAEPTKSEQTASDACTRSGLFVLALSLSLAATVPLWDEQRNELVLGEYIARRLALSLSLEELDADSDWIERSKANPSLKSAPVAQLSKIEILRQVHSSAPPASTPSRRPTVVSTDGRTSTAILTLEGELPPISGIGLAYNIKALEELEATLRELDDTRMLDRARNAHGLYDVLIYRWQRKAAALQLVQEQSDHPEAVVTPYGTLARQASAPSATSTPGRLSLATLSLQRVRELAEYDDPKLDVTTKLQGTRGKQVDVAVGALPRNLLLASLAVETMLAFTLAYFAAFLREATTSITFPTPGTLFGAFSRSIVTQGVLCVAVLVPLFVSVAVAVASKHVAAVGFAAVVTLQVTWLLWTLGARDAFRWRR